ncbi:TWIN LOV 1-like protein [Skeletonema marinoi]|uniref:TWIN LOV 1-like protein n=1 Tax=Skeletonema marinoi TaxID=267567 RepID=A0AAD8YM81_9STRA|nr:TWIN LOV 1-like protein [Skeletonema marinoi]
MSPSASCIAIPQYTTAPSNKSTDADCFNTMDSALDFDLLAEYLLEDLGASGGFDFSPENPSVTPPNVTNVQYKLDPGVVTPHQSDPSFFADPLSDPNLLINGDMTNELSQVQQMIANQARAPPAPIQQPTVQPQLPQAPTNPAAVVAAPVMVKTEPIAPAAPTTVQQTLVRPLVPNTSQPNKRPRVDVPGVRGGQPAQQVAKTSFSLASASAAAAAATAAEQAEDASKPKSQAQIDRRRERNRILARRTRLRKKFFFESLQKDVSDLQRENAALKSIVRSRLKPDDAKALLSQCNANEKLPSIANSGEAGDENGAGTADGDGVVKQLDKEDFNLISSIQNSQQCFIITDPSLHDNPIVYASDDFLTLTGYSQDQVLGRNCRFLQGNETSQEKVDLIRKAVKVGEDVSVTFANYTSDGTPFWNNLFIAALRDADDNIVNFIGVIVKVDGPEQGDAEYGKVLSKE